MTPFALSPLSPFSNCTFSGNNAFRGGGIISRFNSGVRSTTLRNCTLTNCTANSTSGGGADGGGGFYAEGGAQQHHVGNTLIAGNTNTINPDVRGNYTSEGHNFIGSAGSSVGFSNGVNGDKVGTNAAPLPAMLGTLVLAGGSTQTHPLLYGSGAIDAGDDVLALPTDQRRRLRLRASDIGAFEFEGVPLRLIDVRRSGNNLVVTFDAIQGRNYRLERKATFTEGTWVGVNDMAASATGPTPISHQGAFSLSQACYRVRLLP